MRREIEWLKNETKSQNIKIHGLDEEHKKFRSSKVKHLMMSQRQSLYQSLILEFQNFSETFSGMSKKGFRLITREQELWWTHISCLHPHYMNLGSSGILQFEEALKNIKWYIIERGEVRREDEKIMRRRGDHLYYYGNIKCYKGVSFYINKNIIRYSGKGK